MPLGIVRISSKELSHLIKGLNVVDVRIASNDNQWSYSIDLLIEHPDAPIVAEGDLLPRSNNLLLHRCDDGSIHVEKILWE